MFYNRIIKFNSLYHLISDDLSLEISI